MSNIFRNNRGATAVEFALVALPVLVFILGIIQTAFLVWVDNLLHVSVQAAARCGAIKSTTPPCNGSNMISTATQVFAPLTGATFVANTVGCNGKGLVGTYQVTFVFLVNMTITARSCYPTISP